jgi:hypothetical protein
MDRTRCKALLAMSFTQIEEDSAYYSRDHGDRNGPDDPSITTVQGVSRDCPAAS